MALTALESFEAYYSEIASKGSPCDITRTAINDLHVRANELLKTHVISGDYCPPDVQFVSANIKDMMTAGKNNIVGSLIKSQGKFLSSFSVKAITRNIRDNRDYVLYCQEKVTLVIYAFCTFMSLLF